MCEEIKECIEQYLLTAPGEGWVKSAALCERFAITERQLRKVGDQDGLCSDFAISSDKGFKHIARASTREWLAFKHRMKRHGIGELVRARNLDRRRSSVLKSVIRPAFTFEKDTCQGVFL
jgi:hypothetical protein